MARSPSPSPSRSLSPSTSGSDVLVELLSSRVRAAVLGFLVAHAENRFSLTELARFLDLSISSVQHECYKLERLKVLKGRREGASRRYWLDHETPFVAQLIDLVSTVLGPECLLGHALADVQGLQGALLAMTPQPQLVLIGELGLEELEIVQGRAASLLGVDQETIDIAFYDTASWVDHRSGDSALMSRLRQAEPVMLVGNGVEIWPG
jgi:AraC-like DNA-binding protein